jgi:hypothetical protein
MPPFIHQSWFRNACILLAVAVLITLLGKDLNWDQYNYHLYIAHAFVHDRFGMDVMPAATNSYLNPIPYLPFYWMAMADWPSLAIALVIGSFHATGLILIWEICERAIFRHSPHVKLLTAWSVVFAALTPVWMGLVGGTFIEPTTAVLVFAALLCASLGSAKTNLLRANTLVASAGLLLGIATGFKLTGIVFAAGLGFALLFGVERTRVIRTASVYTVGLVVGYGLSNGWLAYRLAMEFGNPVFPFMNGFFKSPDFIAESLTHDRFAFNSISELLALPFNMTLYYPWLYVEKLAPDIRPAVLTILLLVLGALAAGRRLQTKIHSPARGGNAAGERNVRTSVHLTHEVKIVWLFVGFSTFFWLATSANGRYGTPLLLLIGPLLVWTLSRLTDKLRVINYALLLVLSIQIMQQSHAWPPRWDTTDWTPTWYAPQIPDRFRTTPFGYLSVGLTHSNSFIAPFLHPDSAFASISGDTWNFSPYATGSKRFYDFFKRYDGRLRVLFATRRDINYVAPNEYLLLNRPLLAWGLTVDPNDCDFLQVNVENDGAKPPQIDLEADTPVLANKYDTRLVTCAVRSGTGESTADKATRARLEPIFDKIEAYCPLLFAPRGWQMSYSKFGWKRHYTKSDIVVYADRGQLTLSRFDYGPFRVRMGRLEAWEKGETPFKCERLPKHW